MSMRRKLVVALGVGALLTACSSSNKTECGAGTVLVDGSCVIDNEVGCGAGTTLIDGGCVALFTDVDGAAKNVGDACGSGTCAGGTVQVEADGTLGCSTAGQGVAEACDGVDNNCDGTADEGFPDADDDSVADCADNCVDDANTNQMDTDGDGVGNACEVCEGQNDDGTDSDEQGIVFARESFQGPDDCITPDVCITRDDNGPVYNRLDPNGTLGNIEWGCGPCDAVEGTFNQGLRSLKGQ